MAYQRSETQKAVDREVVEAIKARMVANLDGLLKEWLPGAMRVGQNYVVRDLDGAPGDNTKIYAQAGNFKRFGPGNGPETGDVLRLAAYCAFKDDVGACIQYYKSHFGLDDKDPARIAKTLRESRDASEKREKVANSDAAKKRQGALGLWLGSQDRPTALIPGTPAAAYLHQRAVGFARLGAESRALRYRPDVWCSIRRDHVPALLAPIFGLDGHFRAVHRTYLDIKSWSPATAAGDVRGHKVRRWRDDSGRFVWGLVGFSHIPDDASRPKSYKLSLGSFGGGHIPIWKGGLGVALRDVPEGADIVTGEGIENCRAYALCNPKAYVICAVSLGNMRVLELPPQIGRLILLCDNDPQGSDAEGDLEKVMAAHQEAGRDVFQLRPELPHKGFDDMLLADRIGAVA